MKLKLIFMIISFSCLMSFVFSANCGADIKCTCGDTISQNYILEEDIICDDKNFVFNIISSKVLDCNGFTIKSNNTNHAIYIIDSNNVEIKNCKFEGFKSAIVTKDIQKFSGGIYQIYSPNNIKIHNNIFNFNDIGVLIDSSKSKNIEISKNIFKNNTLSIDFKGDSFYIWANYFFKDNFKYKKTQNSNFCKDNIENIYLGFEGPKCDCLIPFPAMNVNSPIKFCKGYYEINSPINMNFGASIDCNNSTLSGFNNNAITLRGVSNSYIRNCNFENFNIAVFYGQYIDPVYKYKYFAKNNIFENNRLSNVNYGIWMQDSSGAEKIHNNIFLTNIYGIYNNINTNINASFNYWLYDDLENLHKNFLRNSSIISNKFELYEWEDISINNLNIKTIYDNSEEIDFILKKIAFKPIKNLEILYLVERNNKIIKKEYQNISNLLYLDTKIKYNINLLKGDVLHIIIDPDNKIKETNKGNNIIREIFLNTKYYLDINSKFPILDEVFENHIKSFLNENNIVSSKNLADKTIHIINKKIDPEDIFEDPYAGIIISNSSGIYIEVNQIEGLLASMRLLFEDGYFYIENYNLDIADFSYSKQAGNYLKNIDNFIYYNIENLIFYNLVKDYLYKNIYEENIYELDIFVKDLKINYNLLEFKSKYSFQNLENNYNKNYPIVLSGGLWSDIKYWKKFALDLVEMGYDVYLIEMNGGENLECKKCYNYEYLDLIEFVFPYYIDSVLEISGKEKVKYIGHSNGARVAIDSYTNDYSNIAKLDTLILVGAPGAFEELNYFSKIINKSGKKAIDRMERKKIEHISMARLAHELDSSLGEIFSLWNFLSSDNKKISLNLFKEYYNWISSNEDLQPGINFNNEYFALIYGNWNNLNHDMIVPIEDSIGIFNNVETKNKILIETNAIHMGMSENIQIKETIKKILTKEIFE